jgi:hypothetical protein
MHELFVVSINLCFLQYLRFLTWYVTCLFVNCHDYKSLWSQQPLLPTSDASQKVSQNSPKTAAKPAACLRDGTSWQRNAKLVNSYTRACSKDVNGCCDLKTKVISMLPVCGNFLADRPMYTQTLLK